MARVARRIILLKELVKEGRECGQIQADEPIDEEKQRP
jgi:hypothetical protein